MKGEEIGTTSTMTYNGKLKAEAEAGEEEARFGIIYQFYSADAW